MAVPYQLPRGDPGRGESHPVDDVVQAAFQHLQQDLARDALPPAGLLERLAKLGFQKTVVPPDLLFFPELHAVFGKFLPPRLSVLTGRVGLFLNRALGGQTARTFEEQFLPLPAAYFANGSRVPCHE